MPSMLADAALMSDQDSIGWTSCVHTSISHHAGPNVYLAAVSCPQRHVHVLRHQISVQRHVDIERCCCLADIHEYSVKLA